MPSKAVSWWKQYFWVWLLIALPVGAIISLVLHYGVHTPFWDQWETVTLLQKHAAGTLRFSDFWAQHNEHRILFPNLIIFGLALLTHWDPYYELLVNLVLGLASVSVLLVVLRRTITTPKLLVGITAILIAWLMLSPIQSENWLWGWQIEWFLNVLGVVAALWCLTAKKFSPWWFVGAFVGATSASYSLANGLVIWPVGFVILLLLKKPKQYWASWVGVGVVETFLYYWHYGNPGEPPRSFALHHPIGTIHYILVYLGKPLSPVFATSPIVGAIVIAAFIVSATYLWLYKSKLFMAMLAWFGLALYAGVSAVLTAIGRLGFGVPQAFSSRYATISTLFTVATLVFVVVAIWSYSQINFNVRRRRQLIFSLILLPTTLLMLANYARGIRQIRSQHNNLIAVRHCLQNAQAVNDPCLLTAYPNATIVWQRLEFLRSTKQGGF